VTEILFYHLEQQPLDRVLPVLLEKSLERGWRAVVEGRDETRIAELDEALWVWRDDGFLPHAIAGGEHDTSQPVLLTTDPAINANGAQIRFFVAGAIPRSEPGYERMVFMFDGHDPDAVASARQAWKTLRATDEITYWQQEPGGRWQKKG